MTAQNARPEPDSQPGANQPPPFDNVNLFASDAVLREALTREGGAPYEPQVAAFGARIGASELPRNGCLAFSRHATTKPTARILQVGRYHRHGDDRAAGRFGCAHEYNVCGASRDASFTFGSGQWMPIPFLRARGRSSDGDRGDKRKPRKSWGAGLSF